MSRRGNSEGTITKRKDGRWEARISLPDGKRKCFYGKTRQEVAAKLTAAARDRDRGLPVIFERQTVKEFLVGDAEPGKDGYPKGWLGAARHGIRPKTFVGYEGYIRRHVLPAIGGVQLTRLNPQHLQSMYSAELAKGLSPKTVGHIHAVVHKALDQALRWGMVPRNVAEMVDPPRPKHHEMMVLSPEQARALLAAANGDRLEALYVLAITTGMREGELLALRWRDVDLEGRTLQVRSTLYRITDGVATRGMSSKGLTLGSPKTEKSRRQIALTSTAVAALRRHRAMQVEERLAMGEGWDDQDIVFANRVGKPIEASNLIRRYFKPLLDKAGLPAIRFHDLRHTAATIYLQQRVPPKVVSEMLGHSQVGITLNTYSHVLPDMQKEATLAMEKALAG